MNFMNKDSNTKSGTGSSLLGGKRRFRAAMIGLVTGVAVISTMTVGAFERNFDEYGQAEKKMRGHQKSSKHMMKKMAKYLELSDEQKDSMRTIFKASRESKKAEREEMKAFKAEMKQLVHAESFDEQAVRSLHQAQQAKFADKMVAMAKMKHEMFQVLTSDQKEKWLAFQD